MCKKGKKESEGNLPETEVISIKIALIEKGAVAKQPEKNKKSRRPKRVASASCLW
jgi:hypothetical protein